MTDPNNPLIIEQPAPRANDCPPTWPAVIDDCWNHPPARTDPAWTAMIADMEGRHAEGMRKYGVPLQPSNGRDSLVDMYQEMLDGVAYAWNVMVEATGRRRVEEANRLYLAVRALCHDVRRAIMDREGAPK